MSNESDNIASTDRTGTRHQVLGLFVLAISVMAALGAVFAVRVQEVRDANDMTTLKNEAMSVTLGIEAIRTDEGSYPTKVQGDAFVFADESLIDHVFLRNGHMVESYEADGESYALCLASDRGFWATYESTDRNVDSGEGKCPA